MGVGVQGDPRREVSQYPGYRLQLHPTLEGQSGKSVPQIVKPNPRQPRPPQRTVEHLPHAVRGDGPARRGGEHAGAAPRFLPLYFQNAYRILCQKQGTVGIFLFSAVPPPSPR